MFSSREAEDTERSPDGTRSMTEFVVREFVALDAVDDRNAIEEAIYDASVEL